MKITVVGQGYVGLPLSIEAAKCGYFVYGLDNDSAKVSRLLKGNSDIEDVSDREIQSGLDSKNYYPTVESDVISDSNVILLCVPTPLTDDRKPDLRFLIEAITNTGKNLKAGSLVIVESTIEPGTCRELLLPILLKESKLNIDQFDFAYSPERIDPKNSKWTIRSTPKIVSGLTPNATLRASEFYGKFIETLTICSSLEIAETAKLLENTFRFVNISFINEISIYCQKIGVNLSEVISAASTKPYGFMPFYPSIGVGGHCIPVDPLYLENSAKSVGASMRFIELADQINLEMPHYFIERAEKILGGLNGKKVLVVGISYKPNIADMRESSAKRLISGLLQKGAHVYWHDDLVREWNNSKSVPLTSDYDLAIIATPHDYLDLAMLGNVPILNSPGALK